MYRDSYNLNLFVKIRNEDHECSLSWILGKMRNTLRSAAGSCSRSLCGIRLKKSNLKTQDGSGIRKKDSIRLLLTELLVCTNF